MPNRWHFMPKRWRKIPLRGMFLIRYTITTKKFIHSSYIPPFFSLHPSQCRKIHSSRKNLWYVPALHNHFPSSLWSPFLPLQKIRGPSFYKRKLRFDPQKGNNFHSVENEEVSFLYTLFLYSTRSHLSYLILFLPCNYR